MAVKWRVIEGEIRVFQLAKRKVELTRGGFLLFVFVLREEEKKSFLYLFDQKKIESKR